MSSADGLNGPNISSPPQHPAARLSIECQLFESLVHHLIEKGVLTKNDALSVVQTVAQVKLGAIEENGSEAAVDDPELARLKRLYLSFELMRERPLTSQAFGSDNVLQLRPPLHRDHPEFPRDDN